MSTTVDAKTSEDDRSVTPEIRTSSRWLFIVDVLVIIIMAALMIYGCSWNYFRTHTDVARYECYAIAFWQGMPALNNLPSVADQCGPIIHPEVQYLSQTAIVHSMLRHHLPTSLISFVASQDTTKPFHALPREYPLLTILPFSVGLFAPTHWYQVVFAFAMVLVAALIYVLLVRFRSRKAAIAFAFFLVVGGWGTAAGRFDLVPSALTLGAVLYAVRSKWNWAFAFLALATVLKFYPLVLLLPFLLAQQMQAREQWYSWRRLVPLATFVAVCAVDMGVSLALDVEGTLAPLSYFQYRPIQVESASASLLWLASFLGYPLTFVHTYGSLNVLSSLESAASLLSTIVLAVGLLVTYWLQWRGKIDVATSTLLTLLIVMFTGKVFSPQYMIWVAPLVGYVGEARWKWLLSWGAVSALTTLIYPYIYISTPELLRVPQQPLFFPTTTARNALLFLVVFVVLWYAARIRGAVKPASDSSRRVRSE